MAPRELDLEAAVRGTSILCGSTAGYKKSDRKILKLICFSCGRWFTTEKAKKKHAEDRHRRANLSRCDICNNFVPNIESHRLDVERHLPLDPEVVPDAVHQYIFPAVEELPQADGEALPQADDEALPQADDEALPQADAAALLPQAAHNE